MAQEGPFHTTFMSFVSNFELRMALFGSCWPVGAKKCRVSIRISSATAWSVARSNAQGVYPCSSRTSFKKRFQQTVLLEIPLLGSHKYLNMFSLIRQASVSSACAWLSFFQCAILIRWRLSAAIYELMVTENRVRRSKFCMPSSPSFCQNNPFFQL